MKVAILNKNPQFYPETKSSEEYLKIRLKDHNLQDNVEFYSTIDDVETFMKEKDITSYDVVFVSSSVTHPNHYENAVYDFSEYKHVFVFTGGSPSFFKAQFDTKSFYLNAEKFILWFQKYGTLEKYILRDGMSKGLKEREEEMSRTILSRFKEQKTLSIMDIMKGIKLQPLPNWTELVDYDEIKFLINETDFSEVRKEKVLLGMKETVSENNFELFEIRYLYLVEEMFGYYKDILFKKSI